MKFSVTVLLAAFALALATSHPPSHDKSLEQKCASLSKSLEVLGPKATLLPSQFVKAGTNLTFPAADASCNPRFQIVSVDLCRVALNYSTSSQSAIRMEAWLPTNWTGRFLSTGNGGLGGCIQYSDMDYASSLGFAAVGANNGHEGSRGIAFLNSPDVIEDYAYRSVHTGVVLGKRISKVFYGKPHTKSYWLGCSTGGRQGWKSVQSFPGDFDGVVAGAPAFAFNNLTSWSSNFYVLTGPPDSERFVPFNTWRIIHEDILNQCDGLDGVYDRIIEDPMLCNYNPDGLLCASNQQDNSTCLTPLQAQTVRKILSPLIDPDGSLVFPRMQPGSEIYGAAQVMYNGRVFFSSDWFKYAILSDPNWDPATLNPDNWHESQNRNLFNVQTWNGDISAFKRRGGKVLHYHGLQDGIITSDNSPRYYEHVSKTMGLSSKQLDEFYRYFRISGLAHCSGGSGAGFIGNRAETVSSLDPKDNVLMAVVRWVEKGIAPDVIRGTAYVNGSRAAGIDYKRNHCRWPYRTTYKGSGDPKVESNWKCVKIDGH